MSLFCKQAGAKKVYAVEASPLAKILKDVIRVNQAEDVIEVLIFLIFSVRLLSRDRPRFFDQVGHQTTTASIGNKYFFH